MLGCWGDAWGCVEGGGRAASLQVRPWGAQGWVSGWVGSVEMDGRLNGRMPGRIVPSCPAPHPPCTTPLRVRVLVLSRGGEVVVVAMQKNGEVWVGVGAVRVAGSRN